MRLNVIEAYQDWRREFIKNYRPHLAWEVHPVFVKHGRRAEGTPYAAVIHTPISWLYDEKLGMHLNPLPDPGGKVSRKLPPGGRWITMHRDEQKSPGVRCYITPTKDGTWQVASGWGGALAGAQLTHILPQAEWRSLQRASNATE